MGQNKPKQNPALFDANNKFTWKAAFPRYPLYIKNCGLSQEPSEEPLQKVSISEANNANPSSELFIGSGSIF